MQGVLKLFLKMLKILTNKLELRSRIEIFFNFGTESGARPGLEAVPQDGAHSPSSSDPVAAAPAPAAPSGGRGGARSLSSSDPVAASLAGLAPAQPPGGARSLLSSAAVASAPLQATAQVTAYCH